MNGSFKLARIAGIDVFIHWTFAILIAWLIGIHVLQGNSLVVAITGIGFVLAIFGCVVLHEFGHALTARHYGIRTRDITLLPIGGVARLERMPEDPKQELLVALAGPAVNVVIAALLMIPVYLGSGVSSLSDVPRLGSGFLEKLLYVNIVLVVFNLLPAFPMDGGRVLRALLAQRMDYVRATQAAASVGQIMAIGFGILGLFFNPFLLFIALFVYIGAQQEAQMAQMRSLLAGVPVREAMVTQFRTVAYDTRLEDVVQELLEGQQQDFPVVNQGKFLGILTRSDLVAALAEGRQDTLVTSIMREGCGTVDERDMLQDTFLRMQQAECSTMPVVRDERLTGIITLENIGEWMMIQSAIRKGKSRQHVDNIYRP
ncbi:putative zinc metalloprotease Rip3 [Novipirellula galeiformis]|uniref:Zinc metalloprotease n=1 Tax=Novipirellula galeiformis TaxID=2528004 RepID=A0A5C6CS70_9BACT|nr:site-2 protease family protein [Novipirellula galeiformis]TWU26271.1 putative zinc metalloprotease Rip3 [Novipirellula galeiformis]